MELLVNLGIFILSLFVLLRASDYFIDSAEKIGLALGISPFVIGITIVAFGTSLPELATSITAVLADESSIVLGNVVGSNIANILLVFGLTLAVAGGNLKIGSGMLKLDIPVLLIATAGLFYAVFDGEMGIIESILFLVLLVFYLIKSIRQDSEEQAKVAVHPITYGIFVLAGIFVFLSSKYTIVGISGISEIAGISPDIIALSMVALGTSLPEVVVSMQAAKRGKADMALGNIIGSNIFNILAVMAIPRLIGNLEITKSILDFSLPFMMGVTFLLCVLCFYGKMKKWMGYLLMGMYILYIIYLSLEAL